MANIDTLAMPKNRFHGQNENNDLLSLTSRLAVLCDTFEIPLNPIELRAVSEMLAYVAYSRKTNVSMVADMLASHYGVACVRDLPSRHYQDAIEFLLTLDTDQTS